MNNICIICLFFTGNDKKKKKQICIGGGNYDYKKRFNSVEEVTYDGYIYRTTLRKMQSVLKNGMKGIIYLNRDKGER